MTASSSHRRCGAVLAAVLAVLASGCGGGAPAPVRSGPGSASVSPGVTGAVAPCTPALVTLEPSSSYGDSGVGFLDLRATLASTATGPCELTGFPAVDVLDASGRVLAHAARNATPAPRVVVGPGAVASAQLGAFFIAQDGTRCPAVGAAIRVTLPHATTSQTFQRQLVACVRIDPFVAGPGSGRR